MRPRWVTAAWSRRAAPPSRRASASSAASCSSIAERDRRTDRTLHLADNGSPLNVTAMHGSDEPRSLPLDRCISHSPLASPSRERARASSFFLKSRRGARSPLRQFQGAHGCALGYVASGHLRRGSLGAAADRLNAPALADIYDARWHFSQRIVSPIASIQVLVRCETLRRTSKSKVNIELQIVQSWRPMCATRCLEK